MKSGLEDRNNAAAIVTARQRLVVSMKSGLEDRNNGTNYQGNDAYLAGLNEVRPGRPEQSGSNSGRGFPDGVIVSMKSGLEDRNNREEESLSPQHC